MLFYLGHPSYYSDEIRWSRRFTDAVLLGILVILLWWNQVVQEVYRCCFTWDTRHITLMKSGDPGGLPELFYLVHSSYYSDEIRWSRRFVDAVLLGTPVILLWWKIRRINVRKYIFVETFKATLLVRAMNILHFNNKYIQ